MPFGGESTWDPHIVMKKWMKIVVVTNAFRRGVHLGRDRLDRRRNCAAYTSPMPFGGESTWDTLNT